ncbi:YbbR-like domain-containing protein [Treponema sp.]|uniref:CdaR family protein n=1 Tax=Treponema sp. TaxID=166 RepID=UPI00388D1983
MKVKQLLDKILENWQVKAVCFVISLFLYVIYQNQSVDKKVFSVPLTVESKNGYVSVEPHPKTIAVSARGKAEDLAQVRESDLRAYLDLSYVSQDGSYDFPVLVTLSDSASVLNPLEIKVTPEKVKLRVEEEITSYVDIVPLVMGKPANGYLYKSSTVKPAQIAISGPRSMIKNCKSLQTMPVSMSDASKDFSAKTKVEKKGMFIHHDDIDVNVDVQLEEITTQKQFEKVPVKILNLPDELEIRAMTSEITVTLAGTYNSLENFVPDETFVTADVSQVTEPGTYYIDLSYNIPKNFSMSEGFTKSIPVTFTLKPLTNPDEEKITIVESDSGQLEEKVEKRRKR